MAEPWNCSLYNTVGSRTRSVAASHRSVVPGGHRRHGSSEAICLQLRACVARQSWCSPTHTMMQYQRRMEGYVEQLIFDAMAREGPTRTQSIHLRAAPNEFGTGSNLKALSFCIHTHEEKHETDFVSCRFVCLPTWKNRVEICRGQRRPLSA